MSKDLEEYMANWIKKARHDIITAQTILEYQPLILDVVCFHCQQAIEKYLKVFLVANRVAVEKTHNLNYLQSLCAEIDSDFIEFDFKILTEYAVNARYPDDFFMPELEETKQYLSLSLEIEKVVKQKINFKEK
jgi:HEPN domain-containing protein